MGEPEVVAALLAIGAKAAPPRALWLPPLSWSSNEVRISRKRSRSPSKDSWPQASTRRRATPNIATDEITVEAPKTEAPMTDDGRSPRRARPPLEEAVCGCRNSRCLKLYCTCFAARRFCRGDCRCLRCQNKADDPKRDEALKVARDAKKAEGCNCRKSKCLKKYCECFQKKIQCSGATCRCLDCENRPPPSASESKQQSSSEFSNQHEVPIIFKKKLDSLP